MRAPDCGRASGERPATAPATDAGTPTTPTTAGIGRAADRPALLTIVVPAYDEASRIDGGMARLQAAVDEGAVDPASVELLVVDDGSTDGTAARARSLLRPFPHARVVQQARNAGKGAAVRRGVSLARGRAVAFMDADMAIDPRQIPRVTAALGEADLAIGSRALPGSSAEDDTMGRTAMGWIFNRAVNVLTGVALGDTQCGFKAFRTPVARLLFHGTPIDRFAFDVGLLVTARRLGLRVAEVPVRWRNVQGSRIRPLRDARSMVADILRTRTGLAAAPPVQGVAVAGSPDGCPPAEQLRRVVDWTTPVVAWGADEAVALLPLCPPAAVPHVADRLARALGPSAVRPVAVTLAELAARAPLGVAGGELPPRPVAGE